MIIEDDKKITELIEKTLQRYGYKTYVVEDFSNIKDEFIKNNPSLVLLDINLPFYDGFYWCRDIRTVSNVPIIFISARNSDMDQVMAIENGGDDYIAKKEVTTKRYEEAIKYLDLALKVDAKNEQAVNLKDEYGKAIQEAKSTAKNVTISKSNNSITTTNSNNNTKTQIKIPPITSTVPPVYNSSISVSHVYGTAAIKKEFTKMGFVFSSDTTALYDKNGIKIGLVNQGEYWQVTTKTWGDTEEDLFEDCMTIILGRDLAWDNLIYIDYALEIPNSQHTSPYVKTFINNDMLVVYVYVPK